MFKNRTVRTRLMLLMGIVMAGFGLNYVVNIYQYSIFNRDMQAMYEGSAPEIALLHGISAGNEDAHEKWESYLKTFSSFSLEQHALVESINHQLRQKPLDLAQLQSKIDALIQWHVEDTYLDYQNAKKTLFNNLMIATFLFFLTLVLAIFFFYEMIKSITKSLDAAVKTVNQMALGDTKVVIDYLPTDEFGALFKALQRMNDANNKAVGAIAGFSTGNLDIKLEPRSELDLLAKVLNEMVMTARGMVGILSSISNGDLRVEAKPRSEQDVLGLSLIKMTQNLNQIIGNLQNEIAALNSSSSEIVSSVSQVATGSAETAAAVAETTTSVEELKQTAHISDGKAKDVLMSANETMDVLHASERSLQTTIENMQQIDEKMRLISTGIIKLNEHSQIIREIIESVNDLAEQSNVLAVNAAIEAAKAGEHGKSFAVVAQEIRSLAEQSKGATVQVRSILNDIQNATNEAVLATEQGSKSVEHGLNQSQETSEYMQRLIQSMVGVSEKAEGISEASQQQVTAVNQINVAMNNIREAASQHVDHMKQIESVAFSLNTVGESLKSITDKYQISSRG